MHMRHIIGDLHEYHFYDLCINSDVHMHIRLDKHQLEPWQNSWSFIQASEELFSCNMEVLTANLHNGDN